MIRILLISTYLFLSIPKLNAQIPGSIEFVTGSFMDMRYVKRQDLNHSYTPGLLLGINYEFKFLSKLHFRSGFNYLSVDTKVENYEFQYFSNFNKSMKEIGDVKISGTQYEIASSINYYFKPRIFFLGAGLSILHKSNVKANFFYTEYKYLSDTGDILPNPLVASNLERELFGLGKDYALVISLGYNLKLSKYRYLSCVLRFGDVPFTGSTKETFVPRFFSLSIGYRIN